MTSGAQTILITGATDGLGRALAHRLAADGAALILHRRDPGKLERTADDIRDAHHGTRPRTVLADLADLSQVRRMAAASGRTQTISTCLSATPASAPASQMAATEGPALMATNCGSPSTTSPGSC